MQNNYFDTVKNIGSYNGKTYNDYNQYLKAGGGPSAGTVGSSSDLASGFGTSGGGYQNLINQQKGDENTFNQQYFNAVNAQPSVSSLAEQYGQQVGLPQLQQSALDLTNTLANMPTTQQNATRGFDVNEAQLQKIIADSTSKLAPVVQNVVSGASAAQNQVNQKLGYALQDQQTKLQPFQTEATLLANRFSREMTGYTADASNELSALLTKMSNGTTLSEGEANRANQLAIAEMQNETTRQDLAAQLANNLKVAGIGKSITGLGSNTQQLLNSMTNTKGASTSTPSAPPTYFTPSASGGGGSWGASTQTSPNILQKLGTWFNGLF